MKNSETIIIKLYNTYKFIEPEFLKFKKLPCFNDVKDLKDGVMKINNYIAQEVAEKGFIDTFKKIVSKSDIYNAFAVFHVMSKVNCYDIDEDDIIALAENNEYQPYYDAFIKQYFIKNANDLAKRDINNELLKRVLAARLNSPNRKEKKPRKNSTEIKKEEEQKEIVGERSVELNMANENKYYIIVYKNIDADHNLINKAIAELSESERKLIERKGRISLGIFDKLLTPLEEETFNSILNKIRSKLGLEIIPQENNEIKETKPLSTPGIKTILNEKQQGKKKEKKTKKRGKKPLSIYVLIPVSKNELDQYLTEELTKQELVIIKTREKLIQEKRYDEIPKSYKTITNRIVVRARRRLIYKKSIRRRTGKYSKNKTIKKEIYEYFPSYSREEVDSFIEKLSEDDKEIIKAKCEGKRLNQADTNRFYRVIHQLQDGIIPTPRKKRPKGEFTIIETQEGKGAHPKYSIYALIPVDREILDQYIEKNLNDEEKNIIRTREKIINEKSSERITQRAAYKFARIIKKISEELIPEEDRKEANKNRRKKIRITIYERFELFSKEEIEAGIANLSDEEKKLIERAENGEKLSREEIGKLRHINNKIEKSLYIMRLKKEKLPISREKLVEELSEKEKENINKVGNMLKSEIEEKVQNDELIKEQTNEILKEESSKEFVNNYKTLLSIAMKDPRITRKIDPIDLSVACFRYGIGKNERPRDVNAIAKFYEITPEEVEEISTRILKELYDVLVDGIIDSNAKQYVKIANQNNKEE